jgi:hypothetical protein
MSLTHTHWMHRRGRIWFTCLAAVLGVVCLGNAIHVGGKASIGSWGEAFAMVLVVTSQVLILRKQGQPPAQ